MTADEDFSPVVLHFGSIAVTRGNPPSKGGNPTLTFQMPADLARYWPERFTHVEITVQADGIHLRPLQQAEPKPIDRLPFDV